MSKINYSQEIEDAKEEFIINNLTLTCLPSDLLAFTNNAVIEETFMRSLAVFSMRSKYANGKVILTFPVSLNPNNTDPKAIESREQGFELATQVSNYPYVFIKSKRVYSYISDKAKKSSTGFMMFAVDEIKTTQHVDVQDVIFLELSCIYCDHSSQAQDFRFIKDPANPSDTVSSLDQSPIFNSFAERLKEKDNNIFETYNDLEYAISSRGIETEYDVPLSRVVLFAPDVLSAGDSDGAAISLANLGEGSDNYKEIKITSHVGDLALTSLLTKDANNEELNEDETVSGKFSMDTLYVVHKAFHDLTLGGDSAVNKIVCSRKNKLALLYVGGSQNPFVQYMGRFPARVTIDMIFNNKNVYKHSLESTIAAVNSISSIISYNNSEFPEVSAYNTLKIKSLATSCLGILNVVPNQTSIQATSNSHGLEALTINLVESDMEEFMKVGNVINGKSVQLVDSSKIKALTTYLKSFSKGTTSTSKPVSGVGDSATLHKSVLTTLYSLYQPLKSEARAGGKVGEEVLQAQSAGIISLSSFPNTVNALYISEVINLLNVRAAVMDSEKNGNKLIIDGKEVTIDIEYQKKDIDIRETYRKNGMVDSLMQSAFYQLSALAGKGDSIASTSLSNIKVTDIDTATNGSLFNYTGTNIPDLNLELVGNQNENDLKLISPFFFIAAQSYFKAEDIASAAAIGDESIDQLMDTVINKKIADQSGQDKSSIPGYKFIREERTFGETITSTGGNEIADAGLPESIGHSVGGFTNWNTIPLSTTIQKQVRDLIRRVVPTVPGVPAGSVDLYTKFFIQVAGHESGMGKTLRTGNSSYVGVFQVGVSYIQEALGISEAQAQAGWVRALNDHEYNIRVAVAGTLKIIAMAKKDGNLRNWAVPFIYHNQGPSGARGILKAFHSNQGYPQKGSEMRGNVPKEIPMSSKGTASDVKVYVNYWTNYINAGVLGTTSQSTAKPNLTNKDVLGSNGKILNVDTKAPENMQAVVVTNIIDGDTVHVRDANGKVYKLRLENFDAPETAHGGVITGATTVTVDGKKYTFNGLAWSEPAQPYGNEATQEIKNIGVKLGSTVFVDKFSVASDKKDVYERLITNLYLTDGTDVLLEMVKRGAGVALNTRDTKYQKAMAEAKAARRGMWKDSTTVMAPKVFRDTVAKKAKEASLVESARKRIKGEKESSEKPRENATVTKGFATTNQMIPLKGTPSMNSGFGVRDSRGGQISGNHKGLDFHAANMTPVFALASGVATVKFNPEKPLGGGKMKAGFGKYVIIDHENGFMSLFAHLSSTSVINGQRVKEGDNIGHTGNTGLGRAGGHHLHYEVRFGKFGDNRPIHPFYTTPLKDIPKGNTSYEKYVDAAFRSGKYHTTWLGKGPVNESGAPSMIGAEVDPSNPGDAIFSQDPTSHETELRGIAYKYSVYNEEQLVNLHSKNMAYLQNYALDVAIPCIKVYITIGNENEDFTIGSFVRTDQYFEISGIEDFKLQCNDDNSPIDVVTMSIANPSFIRQDNYSVMGHFLKSDFTQFGTDLESQFIGDRLTLRAGMKLQIRLGYGNNPNRLKTVFNGSISDMSTTNSASVSVVCEGFGKELVNYRISPSEVVKAGGAVTNSSSPIVIGAALQVDSIAHFGERAGFWKAALGSSKTVINSVVPLMLIINLAKKIVDIDKETATVSEASSTSISGDNIKDPESKRLTNAIGVDSLLFFNFTMSNYKQRLYSNIYAAEIEYSDSEYASSYYNYIGNLLGAGHKAGYHYLFYNTTPWDALKAMEFRHPGTMAKPLFYEDRMTMFYGIKEQMYIARDLDPVFMALSATESTFSTEYLSQRPKRFELACGFHMLSTNTNIIANNMGINSNYYTGVNVLYFDSASEYTDEGGRSTFQIKLDDDIVSWDMRYKTVGYSGTHGRYSAWMYGTQELKRESETMYGGKILLVGNPNIKAGDYAYINDDLRKISGIVKIRECSHHMDSRNGYVTEIVPGQYVEAKEFIYSMLFFKLGFAAKLVFGASELAMKQTANGDEIFRQYKDTLQLLGDWTTKDGIFQRVVENGSLPTVGVGSLIGLLLLSTEYFGRKRGWHLAASSTLGSMKTSTQIVGSTARFLADVKYGAKLAELRASVASKARAGTTFARSTSLYKMAAALVKLPFKLLMIPPKLITGATAFLVFKTARTLANIATIASVALLTNPLGWLIKIAGTVLLSHVIMKIEENDFTRQPLLLFPVNLLGRPYQAGARGYQRNTWLESLELNLDRNIKNVNKAAEMVRMSSNNSIQKYVATFIANRTTDYSTSEKILEKAAEKHGKEIKEGK